MDRKMECGQVVIAVVVLTKITVKELAMEHMDIQHLSEKKKKY